MSYQTSLSSAINDLVNGLKCWRIWSLLATSDVKARYRRSTIGQFWITLSMAVTICALGLVYSTIFKIELAVYLPFVAVSFIIWGLIASLINESATVFIESEGYVRTSPLPKSTYIYRMLTRNTMTFAHNMVLVPIVMLVFNIIPTWNTLLFIPAFFLAIINGIWIALMLGTFCARYRDLPQIIVNIVQIGFFVSPVMWGRTQLGSDHQWYVNWNPFAVFLELLRDPLLGTVIETNLWLKAVALTLIGYSIAIPFFARFRSRITYYV